MRFGTFDSMDWTDSLSRTHFSFIESSFFLFEIPTLTAESLSFIKSCFLLLTISSSQPQFQFVLVKMPSLQQKPSKLPIFHQKNSSVRTKIPKSPLASRMARDPQEVAMILPPDVGDVTTIEGLTIGCKIGITIVGIG